MAIYCEKHRTRGMCLDCDKEKREASAVASNDGVMTKTEDLERVIGRFYIEYFKLIKAGCPNNYGETDGFTDSMERLANIVIKREES